MTMMMQRAAMLGGVLALIVAIGSSANAKKGMGDLGALPGCAGQCHTNGGFKIDKKTGEKIPLKTKDAGGKQVCKDRDKCGPVFCQKVKTCCKGAKCETTNVGDPFPNPEKDSKKKEESKPKVLVEPDKAAHCLRYELDQPPQGSGDCGKGYIPVCNPVGDGVYQLCCCLKLN